MRIKELEDALEAEREARMRVCSVNSFVIFFVALYWMYAVQQIQATRIIERIPNYF